MLRMADDAKLSRQELYDLIWTTPISRLAGEFGISGVALGKTCRRMKVPPPPRGYWACVAAGQKPRRTPLPKATGGCPEFVFLSRQSVPRAPEAPPVEVPVIVIAESLETAHSIVKALGKALCRVSVDEHQRLVVPAPSGVVLAFTVETHRRGLLLLDALLKALSARGHTVELSKAELKTGTQWKLVVVVTGENFELSLTEMLDKRPHALSPEEKVKGDEGYTYGIPKYDHYPCGKLELSIHEGTYSESKHRDWDKRPLEHRLRRVILDIEQSTQRRIADRIEAERRRMEHEAAERIRLEKEAEARRQERLILGLEQMVTRWQKVEEIRAFLRAVEDAVPESDRTESFRSWLGWAIDHVREIDPLAQLKTSTYAAESGRP